MKKHLRLLLCIGFILILSSCEKEDNPEAHFTVTHTSGTLKVLFNNTTLGTRDTPKEDLQNSWSFGDGSTSTVASPDHTYAVAGTYTVTLTVTDNSGNSSVITGMIKVP
jgi:PKD repeat protein